MRGPTEPVSVRVRCSDELASWERYGVQASHRKLSGTSSKRRRNVSTLRISLRMTYVAMPSPGLCRVDVNQRHLVLNRCAYVINRIRHSPKESETLQESQ